MTDPRYPIGKFSMPLTTSQEQRQIWIVEIAETPANLRSAAASLTPVRLDTPYREGGWTARQVIHHVPDSHINAYVRFKLALTEDEPIIKPYDEGAWAVLGDVASTPFETSLILLEALHDRWVRLLRTLDEAAFARTFRHPELGLIRLDQNLALYAWHGKHHVAHVASVSRSS
jgi:hypothetical protein